MTAPPKTATPPKRSELAELADRCYRYALALTRDPSVASDLVQDAWVAALKARALHRGYLFPTIRSRFVDRFRRQRLVAMDAFDDQRCASPQVIGTDVLAAERLDRALATLRAEERELIFLSAVEGYSAPEISALTERSAGAVRTMLHRVRAKLRRELDRTMDVRPAADAKVGGRS